MVSLLLYFLLALNYMTLYRLNRRWQSAAAFFRATHEIELTMTMTMIVTMTMTMTLTIFSITSRRDHRI